MRIHQRQLALNALTPICEVILSTIVFEALKWVSIHDVLKRVALRRYESLKTYQVVEIDYALGCYLLKDILYDYEKRWQCQMTNYSIKYALINSIITKVPKSRSIKQTKRSITLDSFKHESARDLPLKYINILFKSVHFRTPANNDNDWQYPLNYPTALRVVFECNKLKSEIMLWSSVYFGGKLGSNCVKLF